MALGYQNVLRIPYVYEKRTVEVSIFFRAVLTMTSLAYSIGW